MIYFDRVSKIYQPSIVALDNVCLTIEPGEFVVVAGHSGAGKTTLLKMILAEDTPTSGSVFFDSEDIHLLGHRQIPRLRRRIGSVFQDHRLLPNKTAFENIAFVMEASGRRDEEIAEDVPHILNLVGLEGKMWHFPREMSGGEKQRVAIARALINQPELLIADEPTGSLDFDNAKEVVDIFKRINESGTTVIMTTHNRDLIKMLDGRLVAMEQGQVVGDSKHKHKI